MVLGDKYKKCMLNTTENDKHIQHNNNIIIISCGFVILCGLFLDFSNKRCRQCRRDMRPSVQLDLTTVRNSLQSAPEPAALDLPPESEHVRQIRGNFLRFFTFGVLGLL